jgi:hypothetical protein
MTVVNLKIEDDFVIPHEALDDAAGHGKVSGGKKEEKKPENAAAGGSSDPEVGIEELRAQLLEEKARADRAEAREKQTRTAADDSSKTAAQIALDNKLQSTTSALSLAEKTLNDLLEQQAELMSEGKFQEASKLSVEIARETNKVDAFTYERGRIEQQKKAPVRSEVETLIDTFSPQGKQWVKEHPDFMTDEKFRLRVFAADAMAKADGIVVDTPEYFESINKTLGLVTSSKEEVNKGGKEEQADTPSGDGVAATSRSAAAVAAPLSRSSGGGGSGGGGGGGRSQEYVLSDLQAEAAEIAGQTPEEYVKNSLAMMKEGTLAADFLKRKGG